MTKHFCNRCLRETTHQSATVADLLDIEDRFNYHLCSDCWTGLLQAMKRYMKERP